MADQPRAAAGRWERRFERVFEASPLILLAGSATLSLAQMNQSLAYRAGSVGIAAAAAAWVLLTYTLRPPAWRGRTAAMLLYLVGLLGFAAVLQHRFTPGSPDGNGRGGVGQDGDGHGFGLNGMAQRLRRVAGSLEIESAPGEGTAVNASVPAIRPEGGR
jgi:hypothetical protein